LAECEDITDEPTLPRIRRPPGRIDDGAPAHVFESPKSYFKNQYFEVLDLVTGELKKRFQQERGMPVAAVMEKLLLDAAQNVIVTDLPSVLDTYKDIDKQRLEIQLKMVPELVRTFNERNPASTKQVTNLRTLCAMMNDVNSSKSMFSEVRTLLHTVLTVPVTTSTAERTFSILRRLKTFLRSTMTQPRLNHVMLLHIYKETTDKLNVISIATKFIAVNDRRKAFFESY
jgi:hypothetical protein